VFYNKNKIKIKIKTPGTGQDSKSAWPDFLKGTSISETPDFMLHFKMTDVFKMASEN
jgi:hypothetical protein